MWILGEIPGGKLVLENAPPPTQGGGIVQTLKLVYPDTSEVIITTDPQDETNPINSGYLKTGGTLSPADLLFECLNKEYFDFVLRDSTFTCIWSVFGFPHIRSYWFTRFYKRNNEWKLVNFEKILEIADGFNSSYLIYFIHENMVYLRSHGSKLKDIVVLFQKDGTLKKFVFNPNDVLNLDDLKIVK